MNGLIEMAYASSLERKERFEIVRQPWVDRLNKPPKTKRQKELYARHMKEIERARETNKCPVCGSILCDDNPLYDRGYRYGLECCGCR